MIEGQDCGEGEEEEKERAAERRSAFALGSQLQDLQVCAVRLRWMWNA